MEDLDRPPRAPSAPGESPDHPNIEGAAFFPLRLVLGAGGGAVEINRPDMIVGRHSSADVRLPLPDVSRRHCRFVFSRGHWQVHDLHSTNGVFLNDGRITQAELKHHDHLRIGSYAFEVDLRSLPQAAAEGEHAARPAQEADLPQRRAS